METKEINVSEIQAEVVESKEVAVDNAGLVQAAVAAAVQGMMDSMNKPKELIVLEAVISADKLPNAEVYKHRSGHFKVYIPKDIRDDIQNWDYQYGIIRRDPFVVPVNEFDYLDDPARFAIAKGQVSLSALDVYGHKEQLMEYVGELGDDEEIAPRARTEIIRVIQEVDAVFAKSIGDLLNLTPDSEFTFEELSILLNQPGVMMVQVDDAEICFKTKAAKIRHTMMGTYIEGTGEMYVYNEQLRKIDHRYYAMAYAGKKALRDSGLFPLGKNEELKEKILARGKKYIEITKAPSYYAYKGDIVRKSYRGPVAFRGTGRVMVDFDAMQTMDPNYYYYFGGTGDRDPQGFKNKGSVDISDEVIMTLSPYVYGFSFLSKVWGEMLVDNLAPIQFREDAYDKLVMEEAQKTMILSLVETQLGSTTKADLIDGKGGGCIFLLAGEPGTGKTLTAEVTAERLKRPLYMVGVGELGTTADELEGNLRQILDIASTWNAVLLLDECDIFMEARTDSNIQRNAMVGVFLRLLEYYQGVLFLTSNRAKNIDKAFYSRISMALNFPGLEAEDRYKIWENNLALNGSNLTEYQIEMLSEYEVNGRQIKNVCRNAHALAQHDGRETEYDDFTMVLDKSEEFQEAVFQQGSESTDMSFNAIAAKHEAPSLVNWGAPSLAGEFIYPEEYYSGYVGFWTRLGRAVKTFFA